MVDAPPAAERPTYVAIANTSIGAATLLGAAIGVSAGLLGVGGTLLVFAALTVAGGIAAWRLPPASEMHVARGESA